MKKSKAEGLPRGPAVRNRPCVRWAPGGGTKTPCASSDCQRKNRVMHTALVSSGAPEDPEDFNLAQLPPPLRSQVFSITCQSGVLPIACDSDEGEATVGLPTVVRNNGDRAVLHLS